MRADKTLLQMKYARIIALIAKRAGIDSEKAMDMFYNSKTYMFMSQGISDFHCLSDNYLAEEVLLEQVKVTEKVTETQQKIIEAIKSNPYLTQTELADIIGVSRMHINKNMAKLQNMGLIRRVGPDKGGHWEVVEK